MNSGMWLRSDAVSRRRFLQRAAISLGGAAVLLSACAPPAPSAPASATQAVATTPIAPTTAAATNGVRFAGVLMPTYIPTTSGPRPELPSTNPNLSDAYITYPANPPSVNRETPGRGGDVTAHVGAYYPPNTQLDANPAWQEINRRLGVTVRMSPTSLTDIVPKTAVLMASDDLPDIISFTQGWNQVPNLPQFAESKCADLTPYLSGDAVKAYPNLAAIPTQAWKHGTYNGRLLAIPIHRPAAYTVWYMNSTVYEAEIGKDVRPKSADDFRRILQTLTHPELNRYGFGAIVSSNTIPWDITSFARMYGAPNNWGLDSSGKLVNMRETEQFKRAVSYVRDLVGAGLYHPDSATFGSIIPTETAFIGGKFVIGTHNMAFYNSLWRRGAALNPPNIPRVLYPFSADGTSQPVFFLGTRMVATTALKKASADRIKELLGVLNWLAAPFGSDEDRLLSFGIPDVDYTLDPRGNPVPTERGPSDASYVPWRYLSSRPYVIYDPDLPDYARVLHTDEQNLVPYGVEDAAFGYYSPANATKGVQINQAFNDGLNAIVRGQKSITDYDQLLKDWITAGGEQIRQEYSQALAAG